MLLRANPSSPRETFKLQSVMKHDRDVGELALKAAEPHIQENLRFLQAQVRSLKDRMRALRKANMLTPRRKYRIVTEILSVTAYLRPGSDN